MQDILLVIPLLLLLTLLLINKKTVERLTNDTCDITDRKIKLLEEKMKIEKIQSRELPNSEMTERINQLDEKITELNEKISKQSEEKKEKDKEEKELEEKELEEKEEEEEEIYSGISAWNTLIEDNYVINGILIFFIFFLASVSIYLFFTSAFAYNKKNQLKLDKMNVKYDNILDDIKKSKVKDSLKIKKGSFFNFLK